MNQNKPVALTFFQLSVATKALHQWHKPDVDRLHDVWMKGAPTPDSRLLDIKNYDPRKLQAGNVEKRLILPTYFIPWFNDVAERRSLDVHPRTAWLALHKIKRAYRLVSNEG